MTKIALEVTKCKLWDFPTWGWYILCSHRLPEVMNGDNLWILPGGYNLNLSPEIFYFLVNFMVCSVSSHPILHPYFAVTGTQKGPCRQQQDLSGKNIGKQWIISLYPLSAFRILKLENILQTEPITLPPPLKHCTRDDFHPHTLKMWKFHMPHPALNFFF